MSSLIEVKDLTFGWSRGDTLLDIPEFRIDRSERVFLKGPSGSGKSTFLGLIAGVLKSDTGEVRLDGENLSDLGSGARDRIRAEKLGVIFQLFNLLPYLNVMDNVTLPCRLSKARRQRVLDRHTSLKGEATRLLNGLGMDEPKLLSAPVRTLSVGQQQRVAAARALLGAPSLVIADEPTSALDSDTRNAFLALLMEEAEAAGSALLFVSHDDALGKQFERQIHLDDLNRLRERGA